MVLIAFLLGETGCVSGTGRAGGMPDGEPQAPGARNLLTVKG
jgi:hypothetical protein